MTHLVILAKKVVFDNFADTAFCFNVRILYGQLYEDNQFYSIVNVTKTAKGLPSTNKLKRHNQAKNHPKKDILFLLFDVHNM